ncbi:MAG: ScyD/ScyE family protein [Thermoanaerobaculia bacterium]
MKDRILTGIALLVLSAVTLSAQPFATGFKAPTEIAFTRHGHLLVVEAGNGPNTGRLSLVDRISAQRRTLIDGLPSGIHQATPPSPSGPSGAVLHGGVVYVTIGTGDGVQPGPLPGTEAPNPSPSSPILSSLLAIRTSRPLELTAGDFLLEPSDHARLDGGETVTLSNGAGEELEIRLVADFPNFTLEPRPDFPENVRLSNPFGVVALGQTLFVVDASQNLISRVDAVSGAYTTLTTFAKLQNPTPVGPPVIDAVPDSIRLRGNELLVTLLSGFPFPAGVAEVRTVDIGTGVNERLVGGLTSAIDVVSLGVSPTSPLVVAEFSVAQLQGQPGRLQLVGPGRTPVTIAEGLITPTGIAVDQQTGEIFVSSIGPGIITRIQAGSQIPLGAPRAILPAVASTSGGFGSRFRTSLQISNPYSFAISGSVVFHPAGVQAQANDPFVTYSLDPFETTVWSDLVAATGASGLGTADVITTAGEAPALLAQVFDDASASSPSLWMPAVSPAAALVAGSRGVLITPSDPGEDRFNVGIRSLESGVVLEVAVYDTGGAMLRSREISYPPNYFVQTAFEALTDGRAPADGAVVFSVVSGSAIVYGSAASHDGTGMTIQVATPAMD